MSQLTPLLLPIIALIVALIVVAGLWYWWTSSQPDAPAERPDQPQQTATAEPSISTSARASALLSNLRSGVEGLMNTTGSIEVRRVGPGGVTSTEMIEVLRLYRDLSSGALVVQIGRQKYYSLDEIAEPQVRRRFLGNAEAMAQFAQLKKGTSPLIDWSSAPSTVNQVRPAYPVDAQAMPSSSPPPPPPLIPAVPQTPQPPSIASMPSATQTGMGKKGAEEAAPKSIADEIEELLQYRLALDPVLAYRSIHIRSAEDGTIVVQVDDARFDGVGDVKDDDVRVFLQKVVQEWEARK